MSASDVQESLYGGVDTLGRSWGREWRQVTQAYYDNMVTKCDAKNLKIDVASARNAKDPFPVRKTQANKQTKNHLKAGYRCVTFSDNSHKLSLSFLAGKFEDMLELGQVTSLRQNGGCEGKLLGSSCLAVISTFGATLNTYFSLMYTVLVKAFFLFKL